MATVELEVGAYVLEVVQEVVLAGEYDEGKLLEIMIPILMKAGEMILMESSFEPGISFFL